MSHRTVVSGATPRRVAIGLALIIGGLSWAGGCGREQPSGSSQVTFPSVPATVGSMDDPSTVPASGAETAAHPQDSVGSSGSALSTKPADPQLTAQLCDACFGGHITEVRAALEKGADVNGRDDRGMTPLMLAAYDGHDEIARLLLERGAEIDAVDQAGHTALMIAAAGPGKETVQLLLVNNATVNLVDRAEAYTALMYAAAEGQIENVRLLLTHGADAGLKDADGETAADFARKNGHTPIVELLK